MQGVIGGPAVMGVRQMSPQSHWTRSRECDGCPALGRDVEAIASGTSRQFFFLAELMNASGEAKAPELLGQSVLGQKTPL